MEPLYDDRPSPSDVEDTSPTTERELRGWFSYGLAAEVFAVCGVGSFLPVTLEQLARERGVLFSDHSTLCVEKPSEDATTTVQSYRRAIHSRDNTQCVVRPFGKDMTTASFAMYTFSIAVIVQALCLVSFSSFADHGHHRKRLLLAFGFIGSTSTMLFLLVSPNMYMLGPLLVIIGVTCLGSSFVLLNSYLPLLVSKHPSIRNGGRTTRGSEGVFLSHSTGIGTESDESPTKSQGLPESQLSTKISSKGIGIGYCAAVLVQCSSIVLLYTFSGSSVAKSSPSLPLRTVLFMVGLCWFVFTIPAAFCLRERPGSPLNIRTHGKNYFRLWLGYASFAWLSLWKTIKVAVKLRQARIFLLAWFLLSDAVATISGTAILFARTELKMGTIPIAILSITATSSGIVGAFVWPRISNRFHLSPNYTIIGCILLMEIIPVYGLLGLLSFVQGWGVGGLQKPWEIFPLAFIHGFVMGGLSSYCRSFFGLLIPPGQEVAFYALYAVTDKGSSAIGPAIVGAIVDKTGTIRPAFGFLAILIAMPGPLIWLIDVERGNKDAATFSKENRTPDMNTYQLLNRSTEADQEADALLMEDG